MPRSLWNARARQDLLDRLERLSPEAKPLWGRMTAPQMLAHLANWMYMADGRLGTADRRLPLRYAPLKQLVVYWLPFPRGIPTAAELISRVPSDWEIERAAVRELVKAFETRDPKASWPIHPAFGKLTSKAWGVLGYRHTDHHFRQFGI
ncbi:MAG: DinB family protein [Gemmatimonadota bacterium]|nr:DinB family protein [Gemmatimonadota bacterium]